MRVIDCDQNSIQWHQARCGRATGSRIADVTAKGKGGAPSAMRATYLGELVAERLSGFQTMDGYKSPAMKWGTDNEASACAMYAFMYDAEPTSVGFVLHPTLDMAGASPDRLVGDKGLIQIKCPNQSTHADFLRGASIPGAYMKQMQWEMLCAEREWCDYVSFDPRWPAEMQLHRKRILRNDMIIKELEAEVRVFLSDVDEAVMELRKMYLSEAKAA